MKKRITSLVFALGVGFALFGCGEKESAVSFVDQLKVGAISVGQSVNSENNSSSFGSVVGSQVGRSATIK